MASKKTIHIEVKNTKVPVTMQKHHWSKQLKLSAHQDGRVTLTLPKRASWKTGEDFLAKSRKWLSQHAKLDVKPVRKPTKSERQQARELVEQKLMKWGPQIGLGWESVRIGSQKTRWGSASTKGTLSFNWRLIELPDELVDYVVVHELCHLKHMNHSREFWQQVGRFLPDYSKSQSLLKVRDCSANVT